MAVPLAVGYPVRCRVWTTTTGAGGQAAVNTEHYLVASVGATPATDLDVATTLDSIVENEYKVLMTGIAEYRGVQAQILNTIPPYLAFYAEQFTIANAGAGTAGTVALPGQVCGIGSYQTLQAGRAFRGRVYIPFPDVADDNGGGSPTNSYITRLNLLVSSLSVGLSVAVAGRTATLVRVLLHRKNKAGTTPTPTPILSFETTQGWATQRRRGSFGRQNRSPI
jgi:hypothetical protein